MQLADGHVTNTIGVCYMRNWLPAAVGVFIKVRLAPDFIASPLTPSEQMPQVSPRLDTGALAFEAATDVNAFALSSICSRPISFAGLLTSCKPRRTRSKTR
jgi:hypothetical protein